MRASFPNRDPELSIFPDGWVTEKTLWTPPKPPAKNESFVTLESPMLHDKTMFQNYMVGVKGRCEVYDPPVRCSPLRRAATCTAARCLSISRCRRLIERPRC